MKAIAILPPIELETTSGIKPRQSQTETIKITQLQFYLTLAGEGEFTAGLRGRGAAKFQRDAKAEIETAFAIRGEGYLSDSVHESLLRAVENTTITVDVNGVQLGPSVLWCFLPFMDAVANARFVARAAPAASASTNGAAASAA